MSTALHSEHDAPADVDTVFRALSGEGWAHRKAEVLNDGSTVERREERPDGGVLLQVSRDIPGGVPGFLERFLPRDGRALQTDEWGPAGADGVRRGSWRADIPGAPAKVEGTMRLEPAGSGTRYVIDGEVTVKIPVVGGKAERFLADLVTKLTGKEAQVLQGMVTGP